MCTDLNAMYQIALIIATICLSIATVAPLMTYWASRRPINGEYRHVERLEEHCRALKQRAVIH